MIMAQNRKKNLNAMCYGFLQLHGSLVEGAVSEAD